ncbi:MAG: dehydratase [Chloroflexi bacterium]|nr:dehydratase [Chloroflexota bacterium]|tara:strand:+ start:2591 stop:3073 length:483 start_codon:yes stop_codon:yes gene_type:complete
MDSEKNIIESKDSFGGWFEEFSPGQIFKHWPGKTITEMDNHLFSLLTMNDNPLHTDENYMSDHQHGRTLVNGLLIMSLVVGMSVRQTSGKAIANLLYESVTHDGPTFHGDTIYAESEVIEVTPSRSRDDRGMIYIESRGINQKGDKVLTLRRKFLVKRKA